MRAQSSWCAKAPRGETHLALTASCGSRGGSLCLPPLGAVLLHQLPDFLCAPAWQVSARCGERHKDSTMPSARLTRAHPSLLWQCLAHTGGDHQAPRGHPPRLSTRRRESPGSAGPGSAQLSRAVSPRTARCTCSSWASRSAAARSSALRCALACALAWPGEDGRNYLVAGESAPRAPPSPQLLETKVARRHALAHSRTQRREHARPGARVAPHGAPFLGKQELSKHPTGAHLRVAVLLLVGVARLPLLTAVALLRNHSPGDPYFSTLNGARPHCLTPPCARAHSLPWPRLH